MRNGCAPQRHVAFPTLPCRRPLAVRTTATQNRRGNDYRQFPSFAKQHKNENETLSDDGHAPTDARPPLVHATLPRTTTSTATPPSREPHSFSRRAHRPPRRRHDRNANSGHQNRPAPRLAERPPSQQPSRCLSRRSSSPGLFSTHRSRVSFKGRNIVLQAPPAFLASSNSSRGRWRRRFRQGSPASEKSGKFSQGGGRRAP